jgi:HSP20 family protein
MKPTRWNPFGTVFSPLRQLRNEMHRLFDRFSGDGARLLGLGGYPALNLWEDGEAVHVEAELPGVEFNDLEVLVNGGNELTVKGQRKSTLPEKSVWHRQERAVGTFSRTVMLPYAVDADKVEARLENGVLHVTLARHESARPRKIAVKGE